MVIIAFCTFWAGSASAGSESACECKQLEVIYWDGSRGRVLESPERSVAPTWLHHSSAGAIAAAGPDLAAAGARL